MTRTWLAAALAIAALSSQARADELENPGAVYAVQERKFRLTHELAFGVGILPLDAFYKGLTAQVSYTFHFNDHLAWQVGRGTYSYNLDTGLRAQLVRDFGVQTTAFEEVQWMVGSDLVWSPLYGKLSLLNSSVIYTETYFILGGSALKVSNIAGASALPFRPAVNVGLGVRLFRSQTLSFRIDVTDNIVISSKPFHVMNVQLLAAVNFGSTE
jgi:outer membrane beta-barrel protein